MDMKMKSNDEFWLDKKTPIYIYGASYIGTVTAKALIENKANVQGFIDQRAEEIQSVQGLPVFNPHMLDIPVSSIIFVGVKNVYYHKDIVKLLNNYGYFNIIYKSSNAIQNVMDESEKRLDEAYERMYKRGIIEAGCFPVIVSMEQEKGVYSKLIEEKEEVLLLLPVEIVYTGITDSQWTNVPVLAAIPYLELFRFFLGGKEGNIGNIEPYLRLCEKGAESENVKITAKWKKYVIENRYDIFVKMWERLEEDPLFFRKTAPKATFNSKGYFNLETGKHRVIFQVALGYARIPVRITMDDYHKYVDKEETFFKDERKKRIALQKKLNDLYYKKELQGNCGREKINPERLSENEYEKKFFEMMRN